jgi:hypothetical protein
MSQVLVIEDNESLRGILKLNAAKSLGVDVIEKKSTAEAVSFIQILPGLDLIICREKMHGSFDIINTLMTDKLNIPLIWIGSKQPLYKQTIMMPMDSAWDKILIEAGKVLGIDYKNQTDESSVGFTPVDCHYFLNINSTSLGCDVYLKLNREGCDHFVKCLHSTDSFTRADIEKYMNGGLKEFYVTKSHFVQFVNFVTNQFVLKLDEAKLGAEERISVTGEAYKITMDRIQSLGLDDFAVNVAEASIKSMTASISENNALGNFLKLMKVNSLSYAYANAYLNSLILQKVVEHFEWCTASIKARLTYVAYFHNCSLKDEHLMKILSYDQLEVADLTSKEREMVLTHAMQSAALVDKFPTVPEGVSTIIKEHHGSKNGIGFPETLSTNISPVSMMFIVVEDFVDEFLKVSEKPTKADFEYIYTHLSARYTSHTYAQTLQILDEVIFKKNS